MSAEHDTLLLLVLVPAVIHLLVCYTFHQKIYALGVFCTTRCNPLVMPLQHLAALQRTFTPRLNAGVNSWSHLGLAI
jgi:hypothetical protein